MQRKPIRLTTHVVERYQERVRPTLTIASTRYELERVLGVADLRIKPRGRDDDADAVADLGEIGVLLRDEGRHWLAVSVIVPGYVDPEHRAKRNSRNQDTRTRRRRSRQKGRKHQDSRTQTARRSGPVHEDILGAEEPSSTNKGGER